MGETTKENEIEKEQKHGENDEAGEKLAKDKKKNKKEKKAEKKEKNPEDRKDPTKLKAKLEKIDSKIQAFNVKRQEILKLLEQLQPNNNASASAGADQQA